MTREQAFAAFGAKLRNVQWSWSARSPDGGTVVITAWQDYFRRDPRYLYWARELMEFKPARIHPRLLNWSFRASPQAAWLLEEAERDGTENSTPAGTVQESHAP